jgi:hypothetical protein
MLNIHEQQYAVPITFSTFDNTVRRMCMSIKSFAVGFEVLTVVVKKNTILYIKPCSPLNVNRCFDLPHTFMLIYCLACSTLKMEVICSSKMSFDFQQTAQHYIPEDSTLSNLSQFFYPICNNVLCHLKSFFQSHFYFGKCRKI